MVDIKCRDCGETLQGTSPHKHFCPNCVRKRLNQASAKYRYSAKGQKQSRLYYATHRDRYKTPKIACPECGQPMCKVSKLCRACKDKQYRGEKHASWKGGRTSDAHGYILIYKPAYPRANKRGYVLEHILVWEQAHGKPVPRGWEVHHYNGVKDDNRPSNLFAKSKTQHRLVIPELQKRIQELEALLNNQHQLL